MNSYMLHFADSHFAPVYYILTSFRDSPIKQLQSSVREALPNIFVLGKNNFIKIFYLSSTSNTEYNTRHKLIRSRTYKLRRFLNTICGLKKQFKDKLLLRIFVIYDKKYNVLIYTFTTSYSLHENLDYYFVNNFAYDYYFITKGTFSPS